MILSGRYWNLDPDTGCWVWAMSLGGAGYGQFSLAGVRGLYAHREMYRSQVGPIPPGMHVCHSCDNPRCVNPDHLWLGTPADNMRDKKEKGRAARGERIHTSKLTESQVRVIRASASIGATRAELARVYQVDPSLVSRIASGRSWPHIGDVWEGMA